MFVPADYQPRDEGMILELVRQNALAVLVTNGPDGPRATHVPTILPEATEGETLVGMRIFGHMNRMNPHWATLGGASPALMVFQGPNGYISPTVYGVTPAAPTWNFTAVHIRGTLEPIEDRAETLDVVKRTVATFERDLGTGWDATSSLDYFMRLLPGVGAFHVDVTEAHGMFKLSQEQPAEIRARTAAVFATSERCEHRRLACMMRRVTES